MQWKLQKSVDGYFILRPMHAETLALDVTSTTNLNSNVDVYNTEDSGPDVLEWAEWELRPNEDGSYILVSRGLGLRCAADVLGSSMEDGANVECRLVNGDPCQNWYLEKVNMAAPAEEFTPGETYYLRNYESGKYLSVDGFSTSDSTNVVQSEFTGRKNMQWKTYETEDGYCVLRPAYSKTLALDLADSSDPKCNVDVYNTTEDDPYPDWARWKFRKNDDRTYAILSKKSGEESGLDVTGLSKADGANVTQHPYHDGTNQKWYLEKVNKVHSDEPRDGGNYFIRAYHSGRYLDISGIETANGTPMIQCALNNGLNQRFQLEAVEGEEGYYYLIPGHAKDKVLQMGDSLYDGNPLMQLQDRTGGDNQKFQFIQNDNGTYRIVSKTEKYLDVSYESYSDSEKVVGLYFYKGGANEQFILEGISGTVNTSMTYNYWGSYVDTVTDARGNTVQNTYDSNNRLLTEVTDPKGNSVEYSYDPDTDETTQITASVGEQDVTVGYTYNSVGQLETITHNGFDYTFEYDAFGNTTATKANGHILSSNSYLPHNGLLSESTYGNGETVGYEYDKYGRVTGKTYNGATQFTWKYDNLGNQQEHMDRANGIKYVYQYDLIDRLVGVDASNGQQQRFAYDTKNRLESYLNKVEGETVKTKFVYGNPEEDPQQSPAQLYGIQINDRDVVSYTYDHLSRLDSRILNTLNPFVTSYEYLPGGENESTTLLVGSMQNGDTRLSYTYDAVGNIETISENGELKARYYYDELSQLIREDNKELNQTIVYQYDQGGNILIKTRYAYTEGELGEAIGTDTYSYQAEDLWADVLTGYNGQKFTYDEIGNPLTYRDGMGFTWQHGRQMAGAVTEEEAISYWYNADGIRTKKFRSNGEVTDYYLNGSNIITMITNSIMDPENPRRLDFYYDEQGALLGFRYNGQDYWYIRNGQGDIAGILDSTGTQVVGYTYDSWGVPISTTGSMAGTIGEINPFRYRGYYYDSETGLYYLNSRYYDPVIGRFVNADGFISGDIGLQNTNMYQYCLNNPLNFCDQTGCTVWSIGATANATFIWGISVTWALVIDEKGNIGVQLSYAGTSAENLYCGICDAGMGVMLSCVWDAETIYDMEGYAVQAGASAGGGFYGGLDVIWLDGTELPVSGLSASFGAGVGVDMHVARTWTNETLPLVPSLPFMPSPRRNQAQNRGKSERTVNNTVTPTVNSNTVPTVNSTIASVLGLSVSQVESYRALGLL